MPSNSRGTFRYSAIAGLFLQDDSSTDPSTFDYANTNFGLINRTYGASDSYNETCADTQWQRLTRYVIDLVENSPTNVNYKLLYMGRHGQGVHNVAEDFYGTHAWDAHWSRLDGDDDVNWVDAHLTDLGIAQARAASAFWASVIPQGVPLPESYYTSPLDRCLATAKHTFASLPLPTDRVFAPVVKEMLRECIGVHTCDRRSNLTYIKQHYPGFAVEPGFTEDDELFSAEHRETNEEMDARLRGLLDNVFEHDGNTFISFTSHSGAIASILRVLEHIPFGLPTGSVIPVLVKAERVSM